MGAMQVQTSSIREVDRQAEGHQEAEHTMRRKGERKRIGSLNESRALWLLCPLEPDDGIIGAPKRQDWCVPDKFPAILPKFGCNASRECFGGIKPSFFVALFTTAVTERTLKF